MSLSVRSPINPRSLAGRLFLSAILLSVIVLVTAGTILSAINRRTVVAAFDAIGWYWGGRWRDPVDHQHFSAMPS